MFGSGRLEMEMFALASRYAGRGRGRDYFGVRCTAGQRPYGPAYYYIACRRIPLDLGFSVSAKRIARIVSRAAARAR
jgi:hypothetical protein